MKLVRILMAVAIASSASRGLAQQQPGWPPEPDAPNPCITAPKMVVVGATVTFTIPPCATFIKYKLWGSGGNSDVDFLGWSEAEGGGGAEMFGVLPVTSGDVYTVRSPLSSTVPHDGGDGAMLWKGTNLNFSTLVAVGGPGGGGASAVNYLPGIGGPGQCPDITGNGGDGYFNLLSAKVAVGGGGGASYAYGHGGVRPFGAVPPAAVCLDGTDGLGGPGGNVSQGGVNAGRGGRGYYQGGSAAECSNPASGSNSAGGGGAGSSFWHYISLFPGDPRPNADLMATQCYPGAGWAAANGNDPDYHYPYGAGGLPTSNPGEWRGGSGAAVIWLQADRQAVESDDWFPGAWSWTDACSVAVAHDFPGTSVLMTNPPCAPPYSATMTCRQAWDRVWDRVCNYVCHDAGPHQNQTMRFRVGC